MRDIIRFSKTLLPIHAGTIIFRSPTTRAVAYNFFFSFIPGRTRQTYRVLTFQNVQIGACTYIDMRYNNKSAVVRNIFYSFEFANKTYFNFEGGDDIEFDIILCSR